MTATSAANNTISLSDQQVEQLEMAISYSKALASPVRLAIVGALAGSVKETLRVDELARQINVRPETLERDLRQLAEVGIIVVEEWDVLRAGSEPQPLRVRFNSDYLKLVPQTITVLHHIYNQARPSAERPKQDERSQVLSRFMKDGRILALPVGFKRTKYLLDEVAKAFVTERTYTEREIDAILKEIYPPDHCTIRRYLVDTGLLHRENGTYWKGEEGS